MLIDDLFAARMRAQVRQIERYRRRVLRREGRVLDEDSAALEWIARYAARFPPLDGRCAPAGHRRERAAVR